MELTSHRQCQTVVTAPVAGGGAAPAGAESGDAGRRGDTTSGQLAVLTLQSVFSLHFFSVQSISSQW